VSRVTYIAVLLLQFADCMQAGNNLHSGSL
jgi:hypothetical protein